MSAAVEKMIEGVLQREGGFVDRAEDRGGPTNFGITQQTMSEVLGRKASAQDVRLLTREQAKRIYFDRYIVRPGLLKIVSLHVLELAVDCAVNHGVSRAIKMLQQAARVLPDGKFGPVTERAVNAMYPPELYRLLLAARCRFYGNILSNDQTQHIFASGWLNRLSTFIEACP